MEKQIQVKMHPFSSTIISWYKKNARDLPWRQSNDPYVIWLSEIILQQTRIAQGLPYFHRLLEAFPTVQDLANAEEALLFRNWQGLGYYSRARNLHQTAKYIANELGGVFPQKYQDLIQLKGVGPYTAAAIASFAFNEAKAVVDGNVYRILARFFAIETDISHSSARKIFTELADELIPHEFPAEFNQAIMEFGSLQCAPAPLCETCPLQKECKAFSLKRVKDFPVKLKKTKQRDRFFNYFIVEKAGKILVRKRTEKDIWQGLFEFYLMESAKKTTLDGLMEKDDFLRMIPQAILPLKSPAVHILSHQKIHTQAWHVQISDNFMGEIPSNYEWMSPKDFEKQGKSVLLLNLITDNMHLGIFQDDSVAYL
ncbi:MAG: A/G-specific adenine glycosylase [Aquirufa sp.]